MEEMKFDIWQMIGLLEWTVICLLIGIVTGVVVVNFKCKGKEHE